MALKNKLFIILAILFSNLIFVNSIYVCNVSVGEPWLIASYDTGLEVLIVDSQGDMYFEGAGHMVDDKNTFPSFTIGDDIHFNRDTSKFLDYKDNLSIIPNTTRGLEIQNSAGETVGLFAEDGNIYTKGQGIYEGSQAGCLNDGWLYCNSDGITRENRDYFCKITGNKTGYCDYTISGSEDCSTKLSEDTDGGLRKWTAGTVYDYIDCSGGSCTFNTYFDVCTSSTVLQEYRNQGSSYTSTSFDCTNDNYYFCSGLDRMEKQYDCSGGECAFDSNQFIETCTGGSTNVVWACDGFSRRAKTTTTYSPICTSGSCDVSSSSTVEYEDCPSGETCSGGVCEASIVPSCTLEHPKRISYTPTWNKLSTATVNADNQCIANDQELNSINIASDQKSYIVKCNDKGTNLIEGKCYNTHMKRYDGQSLDMRCEVTYYVVDNNFDCSKLTELSLAGNWCSTELQRLVATNCIDSKLTLTCTQKGNQNYLNSDTCIALGDSKVEGQEIVMNFG